MKVLVVGGGGREHAIAYKAAESKDVEVVYCMPGNGGTSLENKCININISNIDDLCKFALDEKIDLTIVGPEAYLEAGIVDKFKKGDLEFLALLKKLQCLRPVKLMPRSL